MKRFILALALALFALPAAAQEWQWTFADLPLVAADGAHTRLRITNATPSWDLTGGTWISVFVGSPFWSWSEYASVPAGEVAEFGPVIPGGDGVLRVLYGCAACDLRSVSWALTVTWPDGSAASMRNGVRWIIWPAGYGPEIFTFPADAHERVVTIFGPTLYSPCYDTAGRQVAVLPRDDSWTEHTRRIAVPDSVAYCKLYAPPIHPDGYYASTYAWLTWRAPSGRFVVGN